MNYVSISLTDRFANPQPSTSLQFIKGFKDSQEAEIAIVQHHVVVCDGVVVSGVRGPHRDTVR